MELAHVIKGAVQTEKSEGQKVNRTYTLEVMPSATKIDVKRALEMFFDVEVSSVRAHRIRAKVRAIGMGRSLTKRHGGKRMYVTLTSKSKPLDLAQFKAS